MQIEPGLWPGRVSGSWILLLAFVLSEDSILLHASCKVPSGGFQDARPGSEHNVKEQSGEPFSSQDRVQDVSYSRLAGAIRRNGNASAATIENDPLPQEPGGLAQAVRQALRRKPGMRSVAESTPEGVLLKHEPVFPVTRRAEVFGCLAFSGAPQDAGGDGGGCSRRSEAPP